MTRFLLILVVVLQVSCKKKSFTVVDEQEGQTNWTKYPYRNIGFGNILNSNTMLKIQGFADGTCYLAGYAGDNHSHKGYLFKSTNGGQSWNEVQLPTTNIGSQAGLGFFESSRGFYSFQEGNIFNTYYTTNGGTSWTNTFATGNVVIVDSLSILIGNNKSVNGGLGWTVFNAPLTAEGNQYSFLHKNYGICATLNGIVARTTDFCETWDTLYYNPFMHFRQVELKDSSTIFAVNEFHELLKSSDGGTTFARVYYSNESITDVAFANDLVGFAATEELTSYYSSAGKGKILKTIDGGNTWTVNYHSDFMGFTSLSVINENTVIACGNQKYLEGLYQMYIVKTTTQGE